MEVRGVEVVFEIFETVGTDVACESVFWSFAGLGSAGVIEILGTFETVGTFETGAVCVSVSWSFAGSGVVWVVETFETLETPVTLETLGTGDAAGVEGSSTGYCARQGWSGRV